jgi:hypothetical protein
MTDPMPDKDADPVTMAQRSPAADAGVGGPADDAGDGDGPLTPPGYPEEVDPAQGPLAGRAGTSLGDLRNPGGS